MMFWDPLILTLKLAFITTVLLFFVSVPIAYWIAYSRSKLKPIFETLISMPIVLPPTVLGFYLLIAFSPNNLIGRWLEEVIGIQLAFSFGGLVIASMIYSLPFMVHPIKSGLVNLSAHLKEASYVMGKSRLTTLLAVLLPNIRSSMITGIILSFAHTVGEFGVVLMIGGSIPGETRVASIAIYEEVEALNYPIAHGYSIALFALTFIVLLSVYLINGGYLKGVLK